MKIRYLDATRLRSRIAFFGRANSAWVIFKKLASRLPKGENCAIFISHASAERKARGSTVQVFELRSEKKTYGKLFSRRSSAL